MRKSDLSGTWSGIFNYPRRFAPCHFSAVLLDGNGMLSGETVEVANVGKAAGRTLHALISGHRNGLGVTFTKVYDGYHQRLIHYAGTANDEGTEITGRWEIHAYWGGSFIMVRSSRTEAQALVDETVEI